MKYAVITKYKESKYSGDGKMHQHTTKWHDKPNDAWNEKDKWYNSICKKVSYSYSSIMHKGD